MNTIARYLLFALLVCVISCNRDSTFDETEIERNQMEPTVFIEGHLNGFVVDENQRPVASATVELDGEISQTDENGFFRFSDARIPSGGGLIKVIKDGFHDGFKFGFLEAGQNSIVKVQLVEEKVMAVFSSDQRGFLEIPGGAQVDIPASGVMLENGGTYSGQVQVVAHYYDPKGGLTLAETMPGDLRGLNQDGTPVQLTTYGMVAVELVGESNEKLQLKEGTTSTLRFPVSSDAPDEIPMWHLDELTGVWKEEGIANKEGEYMVAEVSHFSFWNCDYPGRLVQISGRLVTEASAPIAGAVISITTLENNLTGSGYTNENGFFSGKVPAEKALALGFNNCLNEQIEIDILNEDTNLGDIVVKDENVYKISGQIIDCQSNPNPNAYLYLSSTSASKIFIPSADGIIDDYFIGCDQEEITIRALDFETGAISDPITHQYVNNAYNFGTIETCGDGQLISFTTVSSPDIVILEDAEVTILDGTHVCIFAKDEASEDKMKLVFPFDPTGFKPKLYTHISGAQSAGGSNTYSVNITSPQVSAVGDLLVGSVTSIGEKVISFRLYVDEEVSTSSIVLKAWDDNNQNGIQDTNEEGIRNVGINIIPRDSNLEFASYFEAFTTKTRYDNFTDIDGFLYIDGIVPNSEHYLYYNRSDPPTEPNKGSDDTLDSDFIIQGNTSQAHSQDFTLSEGEKRTDIDIGIIK